MITLRDVTETEQALSSHLILAITNISFSRLLRSKGSREAPGLASHGSPLIGSPLYPIPSHFTLPCTSPLPTSLFPVPHPLPFHSPLHLTLPCISPYGTTKALFT